MTAGSILSAAVVLWLCAAPVSAEEIAISYPGLSGDSASLWMAGEGGFFKENGVDAKLVYMEGGRLSIQSLLSGHTQFMTGDAVSALSAVGAGADIVLLGSAKNVLPYAKSLAPLPIFRNDHRIAKPNTASPTRMAI